VRGAQLSRTDHPPIDFFAEDIYLFEKKEKEEIN